MRIKKSDLPSIVAAVKFRQEQYGWTQIEMAQALGLRQSHYSEFLSGKITLSKKAMRRAYKIGIPAAVLLQE